MEYSRLEEGVSPVVAVILVVGITVALAVGVFVLVGGLAADQGELTRSYSKFASEGAQYTVTLLDGGTGGEVTYLLNGETIYTVQDTAAAVGETVVLSEYAQFCAGDELTVVGGTGSSEAVLQHEVIPNDVNCGLPSTTVSTDATYDGASWIIETTPANTGDRERGYVVLVTDGDSYVASEMVTVQPGDSTTVEITTGEFGPNAVLTIGVVSPSMSSGSYTLSGGSLIGAGGGSLGWTGGPSTGSSFSALTAADEYQSGFQSREGGSPLSLSANRVQAGDTVTLSATLATTVSPSADETLVVQATEVRGETTEVARTEYAIAEGSYTDAAEEFSIEEPGEYVITASLVGDSAVYESGTLTVVPAPSVQIASSSLSSTDVVVGETVTMTAVIENTGSTETTVTPQFFESGSVFGEESLTLEAGTSRTLSKSLTLSEQRMYQFHVGVVEPALVEHTGDIYPSSGGDLTVSTSVDPDGTLTEGEEATFTATPTTTESMTVSEYRWDFGDGTPVRTTTAESLTYAYSRVGSFQYTLTAVATDGTTAKDAGVVTVSRENILLYDGFEEGSLANWSVVRGNFALSNDALTGAYSASLDEHGGHSEIISNEVYPQGSTYKITFEVQTYYGDFSIAYASQGGEEYHIYYNPSGTDNPRFTIERTKGGVTETLAERLDEDVTVNKQTRTTMTIENLDGEIRITVSNGEQTDTITAIDDDPLTHSGHFKLHSYDGALIDDLIVER